MFYNIIRSSKIQLIFFLLIGCVLSICLKYEVMWDFANYHYYNPWAFLNGRVGYDIAPAGLNTYFNPLMDIPLYLMIQYFNDSPNIIYAFQGLYFGGLLYVFFKILGLFFDGSTWTGRASILAAMLIGSTGWATFMQIGTSTNEEAMALLVLLSFYLLLKEIFVSKSGRWQVYFGSGFILGSAMGLKLTVVIYCISTGLSLILFYKEIVKNKRNIPLFILGGILGFLLFNGFWMYMMWDKFQNPFFPFLNNIFQSEYLPNENFRDKKMLPENIWAWIFAPFYRAIFKQGVEENALYLDYRFVFVYIIFIFVVTSLLLSKFRSAMTTKTKFLSVNFFLGYVLWLAVFSINRYTIFLELLAEIILVKIYVYAFPKKEFLQILYISLGIIMFYSCVSTPYYSDCWDKRTDQAYKDRNRAYYVMKNKEMPESKNVYEQYIKINDIKLPQNVVALLYGQPSAVLLPLLNENGVRGIIMHQNVSFDNEGKDIFENYKWKEIKENALKNHKGPKIAIFAENNSVFHPVMLQVSEYTKNMKCRILDNNILFWTICVPPELENKIFADMDNE